MRKNLAIISASTLLASGCGTGESSNHTEPQQPETTPVQSTVPITARPELNVYHGPAKIPASVLKLMEKDPILKSLNEYRLRIYQKRRATVLLGVCATWPNVSGGFTTTINPGIVDYKISKNKASFLTFSAYDTNDPASWQVMNGPSTVKDPAGKLKGNDQDLALEFYRHDHGAVMKDVLLTEQPYVDSQNRAYFEIKNSKEPVMLTGLAPTADYSEANIHAACQALLNHKPLPGILKII